jgi:LPS-assembly protein
MPPLRLRAAALLLSACGLATAAEEPPLVLRLEPRLSEELAARPEGRPVWGSAERLVARIDRDVTLIGAAELRRAGTVVRGDRITYHEADDEVIAVGNVRVVRQGNVFAGPALQLRLDGSAGVFLSPSFALGLYGGRGRAERIEFVGEGKVAMRD